MDLMDFMSGKLFIGAMTVGTIAVVYIDGKFLIDAITKPIKLDREIADMRQFIEKRGGDVAGYVKSYGSKDDHQHIRKGGEALYAEDIAELRKLEMKRGKRRSGSAPDTV